MNNPYFRTEEEPDVEETPDADEVGARLMAHALDMVYVSLAAADRDSDDQYNEERSVNSLLGCDVPANGILRFQPNVTERIALASTPELCESPTNPDWPADYKCKLVSGQTVYFKKRAIEEIVELGIKLHEEFSITNTVSQQGHRKISGWRVKRVEDTQQPGQGHVSPAAVATTELLHAPALSSLPNVTASDKTMAHLMAASYIAANRRDHSGRAVCQGQKRDVSHHRRNDQDRGALPVHRGRPAYRGWPMSAQVREDEPLPWFPIDEPAGGGCARVRKTRTLPLTPRETEVAQLVATGISNREIGVTLGTTVQTVKGQVSAILSKLGLENRTQLALWIRERAA